MPTYDYVCDGCQHEFEEFQSIVDSPKKKCPECGTMKLRRLIGTGAALIFAILRSKDFLGITTSFTAEFLGTETQDRDFLSIVTGHVNLPTIIEV